jgi:REP element-mobilizing transposase RayT
MTCILIHVVFSTKNREPMIPEDIEHDLHAYIGGICRNLDCVLMSAGGVPDHTHLLVNLSKALSLSDLMLNVKRDSSAWLNARLDSEFRWQEGYAGLSIGRSQLESVRRYLANQKEHHRQVTFKEELVELLRRYEIEFDERYIWT